MWCHVTAFTIHLRLQSTSAKSCRLLITNSLNSETWFAVIGLQPERGERPPVTHMPLNKQLPSHPNPKRQWVLYLHLSPQRFWSHRSLTPTVSIPRISSIETRGWESQLNPRKSHVSKFVCHQMLGPLLSMTVQSHSLQFPRGNQDEEISKEKGKQPTRGLGMTLKTGVATKYECTACLPAG